jgi:DUF4097 and DUF4098 domain-containing protein YvlB
MKRAAFILTMSLAVPSWLTAGTVDQTRPASRDGVVEIENVAGSITVVGWDQAEVRVQGTLAAGAELNFDGDGQRTRVEVELEDGDHRGDYSESAIEVHVPSGSSVEIEGVNATIDVSGVSGTVEAETVNGAIKHRGSAGEVSLESVNGDLDVSGAAGRIHAEVVNGTVTIEKSSGQLEAGAVNGKVFVTGGPFSSVALESVAGNVVFDADLEARAHLDAESVSGGVEIFVRSGFLADFDIETFSGEIENELGVGTIERSEFVPSKELHFSTGSGGRVRVETLSGSVAIRKR